MNEIAIKHILANHSPDTMDWAEGLTPAAVLAPFYHTPEGLSLIFTKRTSHLEQHSGQISFPGGRMDPEDPDRLATALRETQEEIGVTPDDIDVWGRLNQEATVTHYSLAPFVGSIPHPYEFTLSTREVERLIIVPLDHLLAPDNFSTNMYPWEGAMYPSYEYRFGGDIIWGATARIVHNLLTLLTTGREPDHTATRATVLRGHRPPRT